MIAAIEQRFQGGGTGEVSGAKISQALTLAAADSRAGAPTAAVILFETGGVRLQEANLGLNAVAEICSALLDLRPLAPVVGVIAGTVGSFGGMSIAAGLCTRLIVTPQARIGLNGPAVIEQEAGVDEFDSSDHALIWAVDGGGNATPPASPTTWFPMTPTLSARPSPTRSARASPTGPFRSQRLDVLAPAGRGRPRRPPAPTDLRRLVRPYLRPTRPAAHPVASAGGHPDARGRAWLTRSAVAHARAVIPSVLSATTDTARYLAVVPDPDNPYYRARDGQVGLTESLALAQAVRELIDADRAAEDKRAIVAVVDLPSQAYGRLEEMVGLHQAMAAAVDAYHAARNAGTRSSPSSSAPRCRAASSLTAFRPTRSWLSTTRGWRSTPCTGPPRRGSHCARSKELDELAKTIMPMSYDVEDWAKLGFCDGLLRSRTPIPRPGRRRDGQRAIADAVERARRAADLSNRLDSEAAVTATRRARSANCLPGNGTQTSTVSAATARSAQAADAAADSLPPTRPRGPGVALAATPWVVVRRAAAPEGSSRSASAGGADRSGMRRRVRPAEVVQCRPEDLRDVDPTGGPRRAGVARAEAVRRRPRPDGADMGSYRQRRLRAGHRHRLP